jgi:colicin import membrane protein
MARSHLEPMPTLGRPADHSEGGGRVWKWVFLSGAAHVAVIIFLLITPFLPNRAPNVPVYTVDLVGGEKLGGGAGTALEPAPKGKPVPEVKAAPEVKETKRETSKETKEKPPSRAQLAKESAKKAAEARAEMTERLAAKTKKEAEEKRAAEAAQVEKVREKLRQRRIDEALETVRNRAAEEERRQQQQKVAAALSSATGEKSGAAAPGVGGTGGGVVKSAEFLRYYNDMIGRIKNSWTWVGRRTDLRVTVNFVVEENGQISGLRLAGTSGDRSYDDSVLNAIRRANPLPPPPESHRSEFRDVELTFTPKDLAS